MRYKITPPQPLLGKQGGFIQREKNENTFYRVNISIGKYKFNQAVETNRGLPSHSRDKTSTVVGAIADIAGSNDRIGLQ